VSRQTTIVGIYGLITLDETSTRQSALSSTAINETLTIFLFPPLLASESNVFDPSVTSDYVLIAPLLASENSFFAPTVTCDYTLDAPLLASENNVFDPTVTTPGDVLFPPLLASESNAFDPTVTPGSVDVDPPLLASESVVYDPTVTTTYVVQPALLASEGAIYDPTVTATYDLLAPVLSSENIIYDPVVTHGDVVLPPLLASVSVIFAPAVVSQFNMGAPLLTSANVIYPPRIDRAVFTSLLTNASNILDPTVTGSLVPPLLVNVNSFFSSSVTTGPVTVMPPLLVDAEVFFTPTVQLQKKTGGNGGGGSGGTVNSNLKYASTVTMTEGGLITALEVTASVSNVVNTRMMIYANAAGNVPGALLARSVDKTSVAVGTNDYALLTPLSVLAGTVLWIALQSDGNFNWFLTNSPGGARYNTDLFSDGPSDPFGSSSTDNKKAPVFTVFLSAVNATVLTPVAGQRQPVPVTRCDARQRRAAVPARERQFLLCTKRAGIQRCAASTAE